MKNLSFVFTLITIFNRVTGFWFWLILNPRSGSGFGFGSENFGITTQRWLWLTLK